jgi:signal transduction histidine kinase
MSERPSRTSPRRSVYAKLMAVMVAMALFLPVLVGGFFVLVVGPMAGRGLERLMADHSELLAASGPDLEAATRAAARLDLGIRYEGPSGRWATDEAVPEAGAAAAPAANGPRSCGLACYVVTRPDGGTYVFTWKLHQRARAIHDRLLVFLLALLVAVVVAAYALLRRILRPLAWLRDAVARLGAGDLDAAVGRRTSDEFGELADAFDAMVGRVREMVRSRDRLLLDVSHELRSPLTRMKVALELGGDGETKRRLEPNVAEMEALVTELLELERLRDGRALELEDCDLVRLVRDAARAFEEQPPGVVLSAGAAELRLRIDPAKVHTVLRNVLENASKFSLPDSGPVRVSIDAPASGAVVRVEDDGPGIPEQDLERLFEPFFRVDRSRSRRTGGYGLGLSLCRRIMAAHGGSIAAKNRAGRGASFRITFPPAP